MYVALFQSRFVRLTSAFTSATVVVCGAAWLLWPRPERVTPPESPSLISAAPKPARPSPVVSATPNTHPVQSPRRIPQGVGGDPFPDDLAEFLSLKEPPGGGDYDYFAADKDALLDRLETAPNMPPELAMILVNTARNPDADEVGRDYSIQHLYPVYTRLARQTEWVDSADAREVRAMLQDAIERPEGTLGGTALHVLDYLSETHAEIAALPIRPAALKMALNAETPEPSRISAVAYCGRHGVMEIRETVRKLAEASANQTLRIAALGALGSVGDEGDLERLREWKNGEPERWLMPAIDGAIRRMEERFNKGATGAPVTGDA